MDELADSTRRMPSGHPKAQEKDMVNHPPHYQGKHGLEAIDAIEAVFGRGGHGPNALKYILRHRAKGRPAEDLGKARWYVDRLIKCPERAERQPSLGFDRISHLADAFGLDGHVRDALLHLVDAVTAPTDDRYRVHLRSCRDALGRAINFLAPSDAESSSALRLPTSNRASESAQ